MALSANVFDTPIMTWAPDQLESQLGYEIKYKTARLAASTSYPKGTWLGPVVASPGTYGLYVHGHSDGTQLPGAITTRAYYTDSNGNIFEGSQASEEVPGVSQLNANLAIGGCFRETDMASAMTSQILSDLQITFPGANVRAGVVGTNSFIQF
jgi:hypothetical protein